MQDLTIRNRANDTGGATFWRDSTDAAVDAWLAERGYGPTGEPLQPTRATDALPFRPSAAASFGPDVAGIGEDGCRSIIRNVAATRNVARRLLCSIGEAVAIRTWLVADEARRQSERDALVDIMLGEDSSGERIRSAGNRASDLQRRGTLADRAMARRAASPYTCGECGESHDPCDVLLGAYTFGTVWIGETAEHGRADASVGDTRHAWPEWLALGRHVPQTRRARRAAAADATNATRRARTAAEQRACDDCRTADSGECKRHRANRQARARMARMRERRAEQNLQSMAAAAEQRARMARASSPDVRAETDA